MSWPRILENFDRGPRRAWQATAGLVAILVAYVGVATAYSLVVPLWEAPDEPEHYEYVRYLRLNGALPESPLPSIQEDGNEESNQPPLYYFLGAVATVWAGDDVPALRPNPYLTWGPVPSRNAVVLPTGDTIFPFSGAAGGAHVVRLVSVALGASIVFLVFRSALVIFSGSVWPAVAAAAIIAFRPGFLASASAINNDNAVMLFGALVFLGLLTIWRRGTRPWLLVAVGAALGLAILSKENALTLVPVAIAWPAVVAVRRAPTLKRKIAGGIVAAGVVATTAGIVSGWWFVRNQLVFGELIRKEFSEGLRLDNLSVARSGEAIQGYLQSFWGWFGWQQVPLPGSVYVVLTAISLAAIIGVAVALFRRRPVSEREPLVWLIVGVAITLLAVEAQRQMTLKVGTDHARLWGPVAAPMAILMAAGLIVWLQRLSRGTATAAIVAGILPFSIATLPLVVAPSFPVPIPVRTSLSGWGLNSTIDARFGEMLALAGYTGPDELPASGSATFGLYWKATAAVDGDYTAFLHLLDPAGRLAAQDDVPLGGPSLGTGEWRLGEAGESRHTLKLDNLAPGTYSLVAGLYLPEDSTVRLVLLGGDVAPVPNAALVRTVRVVP